MRCGRMRCGNIWRCGSKQKQPPKPERPTVEFVDGDMNINVGETGTLRFRYTNADGFSDDISDPLIARLSTIRSDEEYCYITYEGVNAGQTRIYCIAWNGDLNTSAGVYVTVSA